MLWEPLVFHVTNAVKPSETIPLVFPSVLSQQQEYITTRLHCPLHWVKSIRIRSYSGPHFPAFELNRERYSVSFCIQMRKNAEQNNSEYGLFYAVLFSVARIVFCELILYNGHESNKCLQQKYLRQRINSLQIKIYRFHWTLNLRELWFKTSES